MFNLPQKVLFNVVKLHRSPFKLKAHLKCEFHKTQGFFQLFQNFNLHFNFYELSEVSFWI